MVASTGISAGFYTQRLAAWLTRLIVVALCLPASAQAGLCEYVWDGEKISLSLAGRPGFDIVELKAGQGTTQVTLDQIWAFYEANRRIARAVDFFPEFLICGDSEANAFAAKPPKDARAIIAVTSGMLRLVDGDVGMAAAVVGHEIAHHTLGHNEASQSSELLINSVALLIAVMTQAQTGGPFKPQAVAEGIKGGIGLVSRKFSRDQERAADEAGVRHMMAAGFDPRHALALAERLRALGAGGGGFFDTHPDWEERAERLRALIAADPRARQLAAPEPPSSERLSDAERRYHDGRTAFRAGDMQASVREFLASADAGYAPAQDAMGYLHLRGEGGVQKDEAMAARFFRLAADQGYAGAQATLADLYFRGVGGLPKDEAEAIRLTRLAAEQGHTLAEANYGMAHIYGWGGVLKDPIEAVRWLRRAIQKDNDRAQAHLAMLYMRNRELRNPAEAARLYRLAADQGNPVAQAELGDLLLRGGGGLDRDDAEAHRLTRLAAEQGNLLGQYNLAWMYEKGVAAPKDIAQAIYWYGKAAPRSESARARLKALGEGVPAGDAQR